MFSINFKENSATSDLCLLPTANSRQLWTSCDIENIVSKLKSWPLTPPPNLPKLSDLAAKVMAAYLCWNRNFRHISKLRRYSLGLNIEKLFADLLKLVAAAQFAAKEKRPLIISEAIGANDLLKFMLYALWELKSIQEPVFLEIAGYLEEVGKMLYRWQQKTDREIREAR